MHRRAASLVGAGVLAGLLGTGGFIGTAAVPVEPELAPGVSASAPPELSDAARSLSKYVSPGAAYVQGYRTSAEVSNIIQASIQECMARLGFEYIPVVSPPSLPIERSAYREYRRTVGFGWHSGPTIDLSEIPEAEVPDEDLEEYYLALNGIGGEGSADGCINEAYEVVVGDIPLRAAEASRVVAPAADLLLAGEQSYGTCMSAAGYAVSRPPDAEALAELTETQADEMRLAQADVTCLEATFWPAWDEALTLVGEDLAALG